MENNSSDDKKRKLELPELEKVVAGAIDGKATSCPKSGCCPFSIGSWVDLGSNTFVKITSFEHNFDTACVLNGDFFINGQLSGSGNTPCHGYIEPAQSPLPGQ